VPWSIQAWRVRGPRRPRSIAPEAKKDCRKHRGCWRLARADCNPDAPVEAGALPVGWKRLRASILKRDGRRCKPCGTTEQVTVHHITPRPEGSHDPRNLVTLCSTCHDAVEIPAKEVAA
jgi:hypothetical protein